MPLLNLIPIRYPSPRTLQPSGASKLFKQVLDSRERFPVVSRANYVNGGFERGARKRPPQTLFRGRRFYLAAIASVINTTHRYPLAIPLASDTMSGTTRERRRRNSPSGRFRLYFVVDQHRANLIANISRRADRTPAQPCVRRPIDWIGSRMTAAVLRPINSRLPRHCQVCEDVPLKQRARTFSRYFARRGAETEPGVRP